MGKKSSYNGGFSDRADFEVLDIPGTEFKVAINSNGVSSKDVFTDPSGIETNTLTSEDGKKSVTYYKWGRDDQMPYNIIELIGSDEVLSANKLFLTQMCFGMGLRFFKKEDEKALLDDDLQDFINDNAIQEMFVSMIEDMKFFCWSLDVVILNKDNSRIVSIVHKEVENCRLCVTDELGRFTKALYGDFTSNGDASYENVEHIELLDKNAPWKDLKRRVGLLPLEDGSIVEKCDCHKFGILTRMPVPGSRIYPIPPYAAVFKGGWVEIKKLIQMNIKATLKNSNSFKYHVEISKKYWTAKFKEEKVMGDPVRELDVMNKHKKRIVDFLSDVESKGKTLISEYMLDVNGKEEQMIRINTIETKKQGGEWSDDITEACNMLCYSDGIHPNLIGAVPGKTQTNNSGSDKRELFTMKQAMEDMYHKIMMKPFITVLYFNGWKDVAVDVPLIQLTKLDEHMDATAAKLPQN